MKKFFLKLMCSIKGHIYIYPTNKLDFGICQRCGSIWGSIIGLIEWRIAQAQKKFQDYLDEEFRNYQISQSQK